MNILQAYVILGEYIKLRWFETITFAVLCDKNSLEI